MAVEVADAGRIPALVEQLRAGLAQQDAAASELLERAKSSTEQRAAIVAAGGIAALAQLLLSSRSSEKRALEALTLLATGSAANSGAVVEAGALPLLVRQLADDSADSPAAGAACLLGTLFVHSVVHRAAMVTHGAITGLARMLCSPVEEQQAAAASVIFQLSVSRQATYAALAAGVLQLLAQLLGSSSSTVKQQAAAAISRLVHAGMATDLDMAAAAVLAPPVVPQLLKLLHSPLVELQAAAALAVRQVAAAAIQAQEALAAGGAIQALVALLASPDEPVRSAAAAALACFAEESQQHSCATVAAGALPHLVSMLGSHTIQAYRNAVAALAACAKHCCAAVAEAGALLPCVLKLQDAEPAAQETGALGLFYIAVSQESQAEAAAAGALPALVGLLASHSESTRYMAAEALWRFTQHEALRADVVRAGAIPALASLMQQRNHPPAQEHAAEAAANLACSQPAAVAEVLAPLIALLAENNSTAVRRAAAAGMRRVAEQNAEAVAAASDGMHALARVAMTDEDLAADAAATLACLDSECVVNALAQYSQRVKDVVQERMEAAHASVEQHRAERAAAHASAAGSTTEQPAQQLAAAARQAAQQAAGSIGETAQQAAGLDAAALSLQPSQHQDPSPAASVASSAAVPRVCAACGATSGLRRCSGCRSVRYCGPTCSRAHWTQHKGECRRIQAQAAAAKAMAELAAAEPAEAEAAADGASVALGLQP